MSILFEGGCGLQVAKRNWKFASVNTSMAFKLTPSTSQPTESNTCCMLINIIWLFSLWWGGPKLKFSRQTKYCSEMQDDLINKMSCKGSIWINKIIVQNHFKKSSEISEGKSFFCVCVCVCVCEGEHVANKVVLRENSGYWETQQKLNHETPRCIFHGIFRHWKSVVLKWRKTFKKKLSVRHSMKAYWVGLFCHLLFQCSVATRQHKGP